MIFLEGQNKGPDVTALIRNTMTRSESQQVIGPRIVMPDQVEGYQILKTNNSLQKVMDQTQKRSAYFKKDFERQEQNLLSEIEKLKADIQ